MDQELMNKLKKHTMHMAYEDSIKYVFDIAILMTDRNWISAMKLDPDLERPTEGQPREAMVSAFARACRSLDDTAFDELFSNK